MGMSMTKKTVMESSHGPTIVNTMVNGRMVSNTALAYLRLPKVTSVAVNGRMVCEFVGYLRRTEMMAKSLVGRRRSQSATPRQCNLPSDRSNTTLCNRSGTLLVCNAVD